MVHARTSFGHRGEDLAVVFLQSHGFTIVERNFRIRGGEIDIIAEKRGRIHFVEVKTRRDTSYGFPEEAVTRTKLQSITLTAHAWMSARRSPSTLFQIDVISILFSSSGKLEIQYIENVE